MIDEWKPPTDPVNEWIPPTAPINPAQEESFLGKARDWAFQPLLPEIEHAKEESAFGRDIPGLNKIYPGGIPLPNLRGIYNELIRPISSPIGIATLGMEGAINRPRPVPPSEPLPVRIPRQLTTRLPEQAEAPINTRFIQGQAGVAESGKTYPIDLGPSALPNKKNGTILPREYGEVNQISANLAARQGLEVGQPARASLESPNPNTKLLRGAPDFIAGEEGITARDWVPPTEPISAAEPIQEPVNKPNNQILEDFQKSLRDKNILPPKLQNEAIPELSPVQKVVSTLKDLVSQEEGSVDVDKMKKLLKDNAKLFGNMDWYKTALAKIDDGEFESASRLIKSSLTAPGDSKISYRDLVKRFANFDGNRNKQAPIDSVTEIYQRPEELPALQKLMSAMNEAGPQREQQEQLYSMERARRINSAENIKTPGLEGFYKQLGKLKGELPKVDPQKYGLTETDVDSLIDTVTNSQKLLPYEKIHAKTGLLKLLTGSEVPQKGELQRLGEVFGNDFTDVILMHGGLGGPVPVKVAVEAANLMKSMSASIDLSAPLRQGLPLIGRQEYWSALSKMFSMATSEETYQGVMDSIDQRPNYLLGREAGLRLTTAASDLTQREEAFLSKWAEKIPGVRPSERAYVGFINKLRADTFDSLVDNAKKAGLDVSQGSQLSKEIAKYVNVSTGRGSLGRFEKVGTELNGLLFSPRLIASRLTIMNPNYYIKADPFVRKEALKSLLAIGAVGGITLGLNELAGGSTSFNPLSADFMKARQGNTRLDPWGGFQQYVVAATRFVQGKTDSNATGSYAPTRFSIAENFAANKLSPMASLIYSLTRGQTKTDKFGNTKRVDPFGNEMNVGSDIAKKFEPLLIQDLYDVYKSDPNLLPLGIAAAFGMGMQTYEKNDKPFLKRLHWRD